MIPDDIEILLTDITFLVNMFSHIRAGLATGRLLAPFPSSRVEASPNGSQWAGCSIAWLIPRWVKEWGNEALYESVY